MQEKSLKGFRSASARKGMQTVLVEGKKRSVGIAGTVAGGKSPANVVHVSHAGD